MSSTILIVDDSTFNIYVLTGILGDKYNIMSALGGNDAIRQMVIKKPDLLLLDVFMPDIDGFEVLRYMKSQDELSNIPVIFVTGEHDVASEEKGLALGAVDYIKKPYSESVVSVKVRNHLELKAYRDNLELLVQERTRALEEHARALNERTKELEVLTKQLTASREAIIMGMSLMSESHDKVTGDHIERIKIFTKILTEKLLVLYPSAVSKDLADLIILYSPLHDVGKIGISDTILKKKGVLTNDEFQTMKMHTLDGAALLRKTEHFLADDQNGDDLRVAIEIASGHHEKYDGTGYPCGLKGEDIPISARIVALADIYDALRSSRPYKRSFTHEESMDIIINGDGRTKPEDFDPKVLDTFRVINNEFKKIHFT